MKRTVRLVPLAVDVDGADAADLVRHVVHGGGDGAAPDAARVAAHGADEDGVRVGDPVDARDEGVADPGAGPRADGHEPDEEGEHPDVADGADEEALVEALGDAA